MQYERYQRFSTEEHVLRAGGLLCPRPNCGMGIIPPAMENNEECRRIQCIGGCGVSNESSIIIFIVLIILGLCQYKTC